MKLKMLLKEEKELNLEVLVFGLHIFQKARISRNPKTGEKVQTPQKKTIHFKMAKELFNKLNNNE